MSNRIQNVADAFFYSFCDDNLAFAGQQFYRTHFAHIHADRVCCSASLIFYGHQRGCGLFCGHFIC